MDYINNLIKEINKIEEKHRNSECYYKVIPSLGKYYDWSLPPEYKRGLLAGMKPEWSMSSDIYYLMINFYEQVTGHRPEVNFQLNNRATHKLMRCLDIGDKEKKAIALLFIKCTEISEPKRIRNASELINTEAFRYLIEKNPNC